jgi:mRNA interferase MazF
LHEWPTFRVTIQPSAGNGLRKVSQVMIDRSVSVRRTKVGEVFRHVDDDTMRIVSRTLLVFLGLEDAAA